MVSDLDAKSMSRKQGGVRNSQAMWYLIWRQRQSPGKKARLVSARQTGYKAEGSSKEASQVIHVRQNQQVRSQVNIGKLKTTPQLLFAVLRFI